MLFKGNWPRSVQARFKSVAKLKGERATWGFQQLISGWKDVNNHADSSEKEEDVSASSTNGIGMMWQLKRLSMNTSCP